MNFKKVLALMLVLLLSLSTLVGCTQDAAEEVDTDTPVEDEDTDDGEEIELLVSAAASLTDVMEDIEDAYQVDNPNTEITYTYAGSGTLQTQIEEGAPVDVFISAADKQMDTLEEKDLILKDTRSTLLLNKVVLITPKDSDLEINAFEDILNDNIDKVAIGDPTNVPVGQYSEEIFNNLEMMDTLKEKLVFGNDVRTVLTWVETGEVDAGLVYQTDSFTSDEVNIVSEAPEGSHKEVSYPVAVVESSKNAEESKKFVEFLTTDTAKDLFEKYGFEMK